MLLLLLASLAQEFYDDLRTPSLLGRADSTELKNSILSVKKNVLNTRTHVCALRVHKNFHREHLLYSFRCVEDIHACAQKE